MIGQFRVTALIVAGTLALALATSPLSAQGGSEKYAAAPIADLGVQEATKFAFQTQKEKEAGNIVFSSLVSAEQAAVPTGTHYRLCFSVSRGKPLERALVVVHRDQKWQMSMVSWTYTNCEAPTASGQ